MSLDGAGNLGLGVTPSAWLSSFKGFDLSTAGAISGSGSGTILYANCYVNTSSQVIRKNTGYTVRYVAASDIGYHIWLNGVYAASGGGVVTETQVMTLDNNGNLMVGVTSATNTPANGISTYNASSSTQLGIGHSNGTGSGTGYILFNYNSGVIGSITQSGTTAVLYNVTSDQRLKENIQDADSASTLIDSLQVRKFDWKADGNHQRYGFIAQELVTVAPEAVHQPIDPKDMMAVDYSKLVPMLVKEIQSLRQRLSAANL